MMANFITQFLAVVTAVFAWMSALMTGQDLSSCPVPALFGDNCMNVFNYQECLNLVNSGCQTIAMRKSCPAQFVCLDDSTTKCPDLSDSCMNEDNYRQCQEIVAAGCRSLTIDKSCPLKFGCNDEQTQCPDPTAGCMNEDNYRQCRELEAAGCKDVLTMESCPLQFACSNERNERSRSLLGEQPGACVSLYVYSNKKCTGKPIRELTFPTWDKPGSPCYHDALMDRYSVKDQYCNAATGNWHETVFMGSEDCREAFWSKSVDLTFASDGCVDGVGLKECSFTPCTKDGSDKYVHPHFIGRLSLDDEHHDITENTETMSS